jgi:hypothetical protein
MTNRLTDDQIRIIRMQSGWGYVPSHAELKSILDEIEEWRKMDNALVARRKSQDDRPIGFSDDYGKTH